MTTITASIYANNDTRGELIVLALNGGSSSLKFGVYRVNESRTHAVVSGEVESIGASSSKFHAFDANRQALVSEQIPVASQNHALIRIAKLLIDNDMPSPDAIGHRIVHGGPKLRQHCRINKAVLQQLQEASLFAPLHTPATLSLIHYTESHFPSVPQFCVF